MARALKLTRASLTRVDRRLAGLEVVAGRGLRRTQGARHSGWADDERATRTAVAPCFVLSPGRSGTKTVAALFDLSPEIEGVHEPEPMLVSVSYLAYMERAQKPDRAGIWRGAIAQARDWQIFSAHYRGRTWVETNNRMSFLVDSLAAQYPKSRFIVLGRDPFRFVRSVMHRSTYQGHSWDFATIRPSPGDPACSRWEDMSPVACCAWLWNATYECAFESLERLSEDRSMVVQSERVFAGDLATIEAMFRFVGASESPSGRRIRRVLGQGLNIEASAASEPGDDWSPAERDAILEQVAAMASPLGYIDG